MTSLLGAIHAKLAHTLTEAVVRVAVPSAHPLDKAIAAVQKTMRTRRGQLLTYYASHGATGRPLVLLHSVNACASSYEMRPLFERFRQTRPVYALDLPGFGLSGRDDRPYNIDLFAESIRELLSRVRDRAEPADVVASSLTSEFVARVAVAHKDLVHTVSFVSPTGFGPRAPPRPWVRRLDRLVCASPIWPLVFGALVSRPSVAYFLRKSFAGEPDSRLLAYAYEAAHQPGAHHAPRAFVEGTLFTPEVREDVYARLSTPTLVIYDEDGYVRFDELDSFVREHAGWETHRVTQTRGLPQFEKLPEVAAALEAFWRRYGTHTSNEVASS